MKSKESCFSNKKGGLRYLVENEGTFVARIPVNNLCQTVKLFAFTPNAENTLGFHSGTKGWKIDKIV